MILLRRALFAIPLLFGPWLLATGFLLIWQSIANIDPPADLITRGIGFGLGLICVLWAVHGLVTGPDVVRNWWIMTCSLLNILFAVSAFHEPTDPEHLRYIIVVLSALWSLYLFLVFTKRRREQGQVP